MRAMKHSEASYLDFSENLQIGITRQIRLTLKLHMGWFAQHIKNKSPWSLTNSPAAEQSHSRL